MLNTSATSSGAAAAVGADAPRRGRVALLVVGDVVAMLFFATAGRANHHETQSVSDVVTTAAPFIIAWFVCAPWLGAFGRMGSAATTHPRRLLARTAIAWVVAWPVAFLLRGLVFRGDVTAVFMAVALIFNAIFLLGWRGVASFLLWR